MRYIDVTSNDRQPSFSGSLATSTSEFHSRRRPTLSLARIGWEGLIDSVLFAQHSMEMFRAIATTEIPFDVTLMRLTPLPDKILSQIRKRKPYLPWQVSSSAGIVGTLTGTDRRIEGRLSGLIQMLKTCATPPTIAMARCHCRLTRQRNLPLNGG